MSKEQISIHIHGANAQAAAEADHCLSCLQPAQVVFAQNLAHCDIQKGYKCMFGKYIHLILKHKRLFKCKFPLFPMSHWTRLCENMTCAS